MLDSPVGSWMQIIYNDKWIERDPVYSREYYTSGNIVRCQGKKDRKERKVVDTMHSESRRNAKHAD